MLHRLGLFIHIFGIFATGGGSLGLIIMEFAFWKRVTDFSSESRIIFPMMENARDVIKGGVILLLISGILMLISVDWVFVHTLWFPLKFACFLLLPVRGELIATPLMRLIEKEIHYDTYNLMRLNMLKAKMVRFHIVQYLLLTVIVWLVIFKI